MKTRFDFVTNSSSSSFILAFNSEEDGFRQIVDLMSCHESEYICQLLKDFKEEYPIPLDELYDRVHDNLEGDAYWEISEGSNPGWYSRKDSFEDRWYKEHPDAKRGDFYKSDEFQTEKKRLVDKYFGDMMSKIGERSYVVEMEYGDHTTVGSELEHEILPYCDFTIRRFSNH